MGRESKRVVLLEFKDEARAFLTYYEEHNDAPESYCIIALQDEVQVYLKRRGVKYENTLEYFSNTHHGRALSKAEEWYQYLFERLDLSAEKSIKDTYNNSFLFLIRFYMNHFLFFTELLSSIYKQCNITCLYACTATKLPGNGNPLIRENERYIGQIAKAFAEKRGIAFREIPVGLEVGNANAQSFIGRVLIRVLHKTYRFLFLKRLKRNKLLLTTTTEYNVGKLLQNISKDLTGFYSVVVGRYEKNIGLILLYSFFQLTAFRRKSVPLLFPLLPDQMPGKEMGNTVSFEKSFDTATDKLQNEWYESFFYEDISFVDIFIDKIKSCLKASLLTLCRESEQIKYLLRKTNVKLVVSPFARRSAALLGELCQLNGIATLMIGHGMIPKPKNEFERIENYHLAESLILSKFYRNVAIQTPNEELGINSSSSQNHMIKTGPLILSKVDLLRKSEFMSKVVPGIRSSTRILLYPENTRERFNLRFHGFETFDEFLASAVDLVNATKDVEDVHVVIRLHPGKKISPEDFASLLPNSDNLTVSSYQMPFYQILSICDLVISFSSTVIEDALQNRIPVLLYDRRNRYQHYEAYQLSSQKAKKLNGVYYINDFKDLKNGIEWIVHKHLDNDVPASIFEDYVYRENYFINLKRFIKEKFDQ